MSNEIDIWVIDDDRSIRWVLEKALKQEGMNVQSFETADKALKLLGTEEPSILFGALEVEPVSLERSAMDSPRLSP